jgi:hypothetical protein
MTLETKSVGIFVGGMFVGCIVVCLAAGGCGKTGQASYIPSEAAGKQALEIALAGWQSGKPMALIESEGTAAVQPQDSDWRSGKKLVRFSIANEIPTTEGPKKFAVQLTLAGQPKPIETVYLVVGRDPIWVFRDSDYQRATGM